MKDMFLTVLKFLTAVLLLPVVMGITYAFQGEVLRIEAAVYHSFLIGMVSYVIMRFFVYDFSALYAFGQGITTTIFRFFKPFGSAAPFVLPIYTIAIAILYWIFSLIGNMEGEWQQMFLFLLSFTFTMHIVMTAQELYNKDSSAGKPDYFFGMSLVYIVDLFFIALLLNLTLADFSFLRFFLALTGTSFDIYKAVFCQLF